MNAISATKQVAKFVVGSSVSYATASALASNLHPEKAHQKVQAFVGCAVVGAIVAERAENWTDRKIDEAHAWYKENVKKSA